MADWHTSVLATEALDGLAIRAGDTMVDCTTGDGGHLAAVCQQFGSAVNLIGLDADAEQLERAGKRLATSSCSATLLESNFRHLSQALNQAGCPQVQRILFDLGWSAYQLSGSGRGFSWRQDEPLVMTYQTKPDSRATALAVVNYWSDEDLRRVLWEYGEERFARRIVRRIVEHRRERMIETTQELADIVAQAVPGWYRRQRLPPATRTFQALRIAVNDELSALKEALAQVPEVLTAGGRVAIISFHSLEDRIVKHQFRAWQAAGRGRIITKKPIIPSPEEREGNPRSRSAKLRIFAQE